VLERHLTTVLCAAAVWRRYARRLWGSSSNIRVLSCACVWPSPGSDEHVWPAAAGCVWVHSGRWHWTVRITRYELSSAARAADAAAHFTVAVDGNAAANGTWRTVQRATRNAYSNGVLPPVSGSPGGASRVRTDSSAMTCLCRVKMCSTAMVVAILSLRLCHEWSHRCPEQIAIVMPATPRACSTNKSKQTAAAALLSVQHPVPMTRLQQVSCNRSVPVQQAPQFAPNGWPGDPVPAVYAPSDARCRGKDVKQVYRSIVRRSTRRVLGSFGLDYAQRGVANAQPYGTLLQLHNLDVHCLHCDFMSMQAQGLPVQFVSTLVSICVAWWQYMC
jgi:hypothetical protein